MIITPTKKSKTQTQKLIETGMGIIRYFHSLEAKGEMHSAEAKKLAMDSLSSIIFGLILVGDNSKDPFIITVLFASMGIFYLIATIFIYRIKTKVN